MKCCTLLLAVIITTTLQSVELFPLCDDNSFTLCFLKDLITFQQWRHITIIYCNISEKNYIVKHLYRTFGESTYIHTLSGFSDVTSLMNVSSIAGGRVHVIVLPSCSFTCNLITQASKRHLINKYYSWWIIKHVNKENMKNFTLQTTEIKTKIKVSLASDLNLVELHHKNIICFGLVWDIFSYADTTKLLAVYQSNNFWDIVLKSSVSSRLPTYEEKLLYRFSELKNVTIRVGLLMGRPDYHYDCKVELNSNGEITHVSGYSIQLLNILREILKFKVEYVMADSWGLINHEGVWTGLIGLLESNKTDIVLCHPTITKERSQVIDFLYPTMKSRWVLVYQMAKLPLSQDVFIITFSKYMWICHIMLLVLLAGCLRYATWKYYVTTNDMVQPPWTAVEVTLWAIAAACQQGYTKEPINYSSRILFINGYLTSYLLYTGLAAGITSLLAVQSQSSHLQINDAFRMKLEFSAYWDGLQKFYLEKSSDPLHKLMYNKYLHKEKNRLHNMDDLLTNICRDRSMAFASELPVYNKLATTMTTEEACKITVSGVPGTRNYKAFGIQKHSPYKDIFNFWLLKIHESGLMKHSWMHNMVNISECPIGSGYSSVGINHIKSALLMAGFGLAMSIFFLLLELAWNYHNRGIHWQEKSKDDVLYHLHKRRKH